MRKDLIKPGSLRRNILANYVSQFYVTIIGLVAMPLYLRYLGVEAYGLVGFFSMLQAWFNLLDIGMTPTMVRETARYCGGATDALSYRRLVRALEVIFVGVAFAGAGAMFAAAGLIARKWLKVEELPLSQVKFAVEMMALCVALRWLAGLYRSAISGTERLVWLAGYNSAAATLRFVGVLPALMFIGATPEVFFSYQLLVAVLELIGLVVTAYELLPAVPFGQRLGWSFAPIKPVLMFSLTIAFTSSVWVAVTQSDKLLLSKLLPLKDYSYFVLAVLVASGIMTISGPICGALLPRLSKLNAEGDETGLIRLYRNATQLVGVIAIPAALVLAFFSDQVLWAWTGDAEVARQSAPVLTLYALGNGILALAAFPYYLQFAKGDLKLHLIGNALFVGIFIPLLVGATLKYGVVGAGYAWVIANLLPFIFWVPIVHRRFSKGLHCQWLLRDVGAIALPVVAGAAVAHHLVEWPNERAGVVVRIALVSAALLAIGAAGSSRLREALSEHLRARFAG